MKRFRSLLGLIADITGILAFVGLSSTGLLLWLQTRLSFSIAYLLIPLVVLVVLPLTAYVVVKKLWPRVREEHSPWSTSQPKALVFSMAELNERLPSDAHLSEWFGELETHTHEWDQAAGITEYRLLVRLVDKDTRVEPSLTAKSTWRKLKALFSFIKFLDDDSRSRLMEHFEKLPEASTVPGFKRNPLLHEFKGWRQAVAYCFGSVEHLPRTQLSVILTVQLRSKLPMLSVELVDWTQTDGKPELTHHPVATFTQDEMPKNIVTTRKGPST